MDIIKINANTWRIEDGFVYFYLLAGSEKALMIDSGVSPKDAKALAGTLTELPVILANTHGDGDHTAGNDSFDEYYINREDYERCEMGARFSKSKWHDLSEGMVFDLGGRTVRVIEIPGHTYGSVAFLDVTERVLYSGDTVSNATIFMFGDKRSTADFGASLKKLADMRESYDTIYPAHGDPVIPGDYAQKVLDDWNEALAGNLECTSEDKFGNTVKNFHGQSCGFYL